MNGKMKCKLAQNRNYWHCLWQIPFYSTNACGCFHNRVVLFMARVSHMLTHPYAYSSIVILIRFRLYFLFCPLFLWASLDCQLHRCKWIIKNRPYTVNADKMYKRFRDTMDNGIYIVAMPFYCYCNAATGKKLWNFL